MNNKIQIAGSGRQPGHPSILSAWSKAAIASIFKFKLPFNGDNIKNYFLRYTFVFATIISAVFMYFGMHDVLASDFNPDHKPGYKLKLELERKQAELAKSQAEHAARAAAAES